MENGNSYRHILKWGDKHEESISHHMAEVMHVFRVVSFTVSCLICASVLCLTLLMEWWLPVLMKRWRK